MRYETGSIRHRAVGKKSGQTNPIERLSNTFRQRISRLARQTVSFSRKLGWGYLVLYS